MARLPQSQSAPEAKGALKPTVLDQTISAGQQSVTATRILDVNGKKLRLQVKSDSYDFQSHAHADLWSPVEGKWNMVHAIPYGQMKTPTKLVHLPNKTGVAIGPFEADLAKLLSVTVSIVF